MKTEDWEFWVLFNIIVLYDQKILFKSETWYTFESIFDGEKFSLRIFEVKSFSKIIKGKFKKFYKYIH